MRFKTQAKTLETSGEFRKNKFKIAMTAKMFEMLSTKMYSRPEEATFRELLNNGYDAHVAAGKADVPLDVHIPSKTDPVFRVRDYGTGMSDEFVMQNYTTYGDSTKDDDNDAIGGFGIGSKTPFSISSTFTIISIYEGVRQTYTAVIDETGEPDCYAIGEGIKTDECNGVEIIVPVPADKIHGFRNAAPVVLEYYKTLPNINMQEHEYDELRNKEKHIETDDYVFFKSSNGYYNNSKIRVIMGVTAYPVDIDQLELDSTLYSNLRGNSIDLKMEIGDCELQPSREALSYDKLTREVLKEALSCAMENIQQKFCEKIDDIENDFLASIVLNELNTSVNFIPQHYTATDGRKLSVHGQIPYDFRKTEVRKIDNWGYFERLPKLVNSTSLSFRYESNVAFIIDDVPGSYARNERIREAMKDTGYRFFYHFRSRTSVPRAEREEAMKEFRNEILSLIKENAGDPPKDRIIILSETPEVERTSHYATGNSRTSVSGIRRVIDTTFKTYSYISDQLDVINSSVQVDDEKNLPEYGIYIESPRGKPTITDSKQYKILGRINKPTFFVTKTSLRHIPEGWDTAEEAINKFIKNARYGKYLRRKAIRLTCEYGDMIDIARVAKYNPNLKEWIETSAPESFNLLMKYLKEGGGKPQQNNDDVDAVMDAVISLHKNDILNKAKTRWKNRLAKITNDFKSEHYLLHRELFEREFRDEKAIDQILKHVYGFTTS